MKRSITRRTLMVLAAFSAAIASPLAAQTAASDGRDTLDKEAWLQDISQFRREVIERDAAFSEEARIKALRRLDALETRLPAVAGDYTTVTVDLAGHGRSSADRRAWSMAAYGQDVAAVVSSLPNRRIILIGHSMGGYVALEAARLLRGRVIGVIGVDSLQDLDGQTTDEAGAQMLLAELRRHPQATTRRFVLETFFSEQSDPLLARRIADDMAAAPPFVSVPSMEALMDYDPKPAASTLQLPVVAIIGEMMPVDESAARKLVPEFRARKVPGAGHFLQVEEPAAFNAELRLAVARIEARRKGAGRDAEPRHAPIVLGGAAPAAP